MRLVQSAADLRVALAAAHAAEHRIGLVPTMGNLHEGHLSLVRVARRHAALVVASIFVNPLQFAPREDFSQYPRTLDRDCELLAGGGCDIVFAPTVAEVYPEPQEFRVQPPGDLSDILEGSFRPGFFIGVGTVVLKFFNIVRPSVAVFGKKDYQQLRVVQNMVQQFALPIEIVAGDTIREPGGLALSSRNGYLNTAQRAVAPQLYASLRRIIDALCAGRTDFEFLEHEAMSYLAERGWVPDYIAIRCRRRLSLPTGGEPLVVLGAAKLGAIRLLDNIEV